MAACMWVLALWGWQNLTSARFKMGCLNIDFWWQWLFTLHFYLLIYCWYLSAEMLSKHLGMEYAESSCRQPKGRKHGGELPPVSVLKGFFFPPPYTDCSATKTASVQVLLGIYWAVRRCYQATLCTSQQAQEFLQHVKDSAIIQHLQYDFSKLAANKVRWLILWINLCHKPCTITTADLSATWRSS